jgi:hypothetical protein
MISKKMLKLSFLLFLLIPSLAFAKTDVSSVLQIRSYNYSMISEEFEITSK